MIAHIRSLLESTLVPLLQLFMEPLNRALSQIPAPVWRITVCLFLLAGSGWVLFLSREFIYRGSPSRARWRDLRLWIPLLLIPYLWIYLFL